MRRAALLTASFGLAAWIGFLSWGPGGRSVAAADLEHAIRGVKVVHIVGEEQTLSGNSTLPLAVHKDKWLRSEPFSVYEKVSARREGSLGEGFPYVFAGDPSKTIWYFPNRGNKAIITKGLHGDFLQNLLEVIEPDGSGERAWKVTGQILLDGRKCDVLKSEGEVTEEIAVDSTTLLTYRYRQFQTVDGRSNVMVTDLKLAYDENPPEEVFNWAPPTGAKVVDKRKR